MNTAVAASEKIKEITDWILAQNPGVGSINLNQNLFDSGLVSSLKFMEMVLVLENIIDRPINLDNIEFEDFATVNAIAHHLF